MIGRLFAALGRRSLARRGLTLAALALVALLVVASALAPSTHPARHPASAVARPTRTARTPTSSGSRRISPAELLAARRIAARFLAGYLPFLYGRGYASAIEAVTPGMGLALSRSHGLVTPVERQRHPRVVSLTAVGQAPGVVLATALVADGGVSAYALRIMLSASRNGWLVSGVDGA